MLSKIVYFYLMATFPQTAVADVVLAARTLRSHTIITSADIVLQKTENIGSLNKISDVIGLEARVVLYEGRPISLSDVGSPAIIERNQAVSLIYQRGKLQISVDGRSLGRAGVGDLLKVMNLSSRKIITGVVDRTGAVFVDLRAANFSR